METIQKWQIPPDNDNFDIRFEIELSFLSLILYRMSKKK
jgi:hypothetical protein